MEKLKSVSNYQPATICFMIIHAIPWKPDHNFGTSISMVVLINMSTSDQLWTMAHRNNILNTILNMRSTHFWILKYIQIGFPGTPALKTRGTSREQLAPGTGLHRRCRSQGTAILRKSARRCPAKNGSKMYLTSAPVLEDLCRRLYEYIWTYHICVIM